MEVKSFAAVVTVTQVTASLPSPSSSPPEFIPPFPVPPPSLTSLFDLLSQLLFFLLTPSPAYRSLILLVLLLAFVTHLLLHPSPLFSTASSPSP